MEDLTLEMIVDIDAGVWGDLVAEAEFFGLSFSGAEADPILEAGFSESISSLLAMS